MEGFGYEKKIRIMIVDENAEFRSYTANKLREEGFDVVLTTLKSFRISAKGF